ncbi:hypothetical protein [Streptomyces sp. 8N706]|uniref:hypothetical protein n=1 Tax=Streptomyces sp. 8N706 TaxID=3457416 RepID=UPI003FD156D4
MNLNTPLPWPDLADMETHAGLKRLCLLTETTSRSSVKGISTWKNLEHVTIDAPTVPEADREELAELPSLNSLQLLSQDISRLALHPILPNVQRLAISSHQPGNSLLPLIEAFPGLQYLDLFCLTPARVDIAPLADVPGLTIHISYADHLTGAELFPPGHLTRTPRPR